MQDYNSSWLKNVENSGNLRLQNMEEGDCGMVFKDGTYMFDVNKVAKIWCAINEERALCNNNKISY